MPDFTIIEERISFGFFIIFLSILHMNRKGAWVDAFCTITGL